MSEITNPNTAKAVLTAAKENDVWESAIPKDEKQLLTEANFVLEQAESAWANNIRGPAVTAVKFAADVVGASEGRDIESEPSAAESIVSLTIPDVKKEIDAAAASGEIDLIEGILEAEANGKQRSGVVKYAKLAIEDAYKEPDEVTGELESGDRGENHGSGIVTPWESGAVTDIVVSTKASKLDDLFEAEAFARAEASKMNLPVPEAVDDIPAATLSRGVASLTVEDLAERLTDASLCLAAATWQTAIAEIDEEHAKRVGTHYFNKEYAKAAPNAKNKETAVAKAEEAEEVRKWRSKEADAESRYVTFRALKEIYKGTYDTISRVFAMKQEENERS